MLSFGPELAARRTDTWRLNSMGWQIEEWTLARIANGSARPFAVVHIRWDGSTWELWTCSMFSKALEKQVAALLKARPKWEE